MIVKEKAPHKISIVFSSNKRKIKLILKIRISTGKNTKNIISPISYLLITITLESIVIIFLLSNWLHFEITIKAKIDEMRQRNSISKKAKSSSFPTNPSLTEKRMT